MQKQGLKGISSMGASRMSIVQNQPEFRGSLAANHAKGNDFAHTNEVKKNEINIRPSHINPFHGMETTPSTVAPVRYWGENADIEALYSYPG